MDSYTRTGKKRKRYTIQPKKCVNVSKSKTLTNKEPYGDVDKIQIRLKDSQEAPIRPAGDYCRNTDEPALVFTLWTPNHGKHICESALVFTLWTPTHGKHICESALVFTLWTRVIAKRQTNQR